MECKIDYKSYRSYKQPFSDYKMAVAGDGLKPDARPRFYLGGFEPRDFFLQKMFQLSEVLSELVQLKRITNENLRAKSLCGWGVFVIFRKKIHLDHILKVF